MELAEKLTILARSGIRRDAAAVLLGISEDEAQAQLKDPGRADPAPAGGGGGVALAANGGFGDPSATPSFVGWFHDVNDLYNYNGGDLTGLKQGTWALAGTAPPDDPTPGTWVIPTLYVLDADGELGGWWNPVIPSNDAIVNTAKSVTSLPSIDVTFPGAVTFGQTRRLLLPFTGHFTTFTADLRTAGANPTRLDVIVGSYNVGTGVFTPRGSIFNGDPSTRYLGAGRTILSQGMMTPTSAENHFAGGDAIEVQVIDGTGGPSGGSDLTVRLGVEKTT
jgi:hypothetical protein